MIPTPQANVDGTISFVSQEAVMREAKAEPQLKLSEQEMRDISIMAEFARPGRPKIDLILRDEVDAAAGRIAVACEWSSISIYCRRWVVERDSAKAVDRRH